MLGASSKFMVSMEHHANIRSAAHPCILDEELPKGDWVPIFMLLEVSSAFLAFESGRTICPTLKCVRIMFFALDFWPVWYIAEPFWLPDKPHGVRSG